MSGASEPGSKSICGFGARSEAGRGLEAKVMGRSDHAKKLLEAGLAGVPTEAYQCIVDLHWTVAERAVVALFALWNVHKHTRVHVHALLLVHSYGAYGS